MRLWSWISILVLVMIVVGILSWIACAPPLLIKEHGSVAEFDLRNLGEYNSWLGAIEIVDETANRVVWRAVADTAPIRVFSFKIGVGTNPIDLGLRAQDRLVMIDFPRYGEEIYFFAERKYEIRVSSAGCFSSSCAAPSSASQFVLREMAEN